MFQTNIILPWPIEAAMNRILYTFTCLTAAKSSIYTCIFKVFFDITDFIRRRRERLLLIKAWRSLKEQLYAMHQSISSMTTVCLLVSNTYSILLLFFSKPLLFYSYNCSQSEEEEKLAPLCTDLETKVSEGKITLFLIYSPLNSPTTSSVALW